MNRSLIKRTGYVPEVGHYYFSHKLNRWVYLVDKKLGSDPAERSVLYHEKMEKHLHRDIGWTIRKAHPRANVLERRYDIKHGINPSRVNKAVEKVWNENRRPGVRRRK